MIEVSIIIPTYNRRNSLLQCLESLDNQEGLNGMFEVIVVDDGSTDGTTEMLAQLKGQFRYELIVCSQTRFGSGPARNFGAMIARGSILLFTDSDCIAKPVWIGKMSRIICEIGDGVAGAPVDTPSSATLFAKCFNYITHTWIGGMGAQWRLFGFIPGFRLRTMNLAIQTKLFHSLGGFQHMSYGEDTEFSERLTSMGHKLIRYCDADILHCEKRSPIDYILESYAKGRAVMQLLKSGLIPMRGIYFAPFLFFGTMCASFWLGMPAITLTSATVYFALLFYYAFCYAFRSGILGSIGLLPIVAALLHIGYALGTIRGFFERGMPIKGEARPDRGKFILETQEKKSGVTH